MKPNAMTTSAFFALQFMTTLAQPTTAPEQNCPENSVGPAQEAIRTTALIIGVVIAAIALFRNWRHQNVTEWHQLYGATAQEVTNMKAQMKELRLLLGLQNEEKEIVLEDSIQSGLDSFCYHRGDRQRVVTSMRTGAPENMLKLSSKIQTSVALQRYVAYKVGGEDNYRNFMGILNSQLTQQRAPARTPGKKSN